ncbi:MAG: class I SAM-dependent rRNA methyltransferase [Thermoguttaceae bacterium]|nr:class I SAM-dependent rRNA methyltransferase [Thermoguttaceae bacterium]
MAGKRVIIKDDRVPAVLRRHPWVLSSSVMMVESGVGHGDVVDVVTKDGQFLARGIYNKKSRIRVRLYTWDENELLDRDFWRARIVRAVELREQLGYLDPEGACRLVFSEGDALSGLIVDRYGPYLVFQPTAFGLAERLSTFTEIFKEILGPKGILVRKDPAASAAEGFELPEGVLFGEVPEVVTIVEHGIRHRVDLRKGQKTGFYLDQRENRLAAARYLAGRRILDLYCYTGGFSLTAAIRGQARSIEAVDSSDRALQLAREVSSDHGIANIVFLEAEVFPLLEKYVAEGRKFEGVILDPPRFASRRGQIAQALRAYHFVNRLAVSLLEPGGILVSCSCSGRVSRAEFMQVLFGVAEKTGRTIQVLEQRGAAPDHPVNVFCPETDYLKCFICRVI